MKSRMSRVVVSIIFHCVFYFGFLCQSATATIEGNPPPTGIPITGEWKFLVFLVEFEEEDCKHDSAHDINYFNEFLVSTSDNPANPHLSLRDYYREVSYFYRDDFEGWDIAYVDYADPDPAGDGWIEAPYPYSHYDYEFGRYKLVEDIINANSWIDYTQYQQNPNWNYANVIIIYSPCGHRFSYYSTKKSDVVDVDGLGGVQYSIFPEDASLGMACHEVGHQLGFLDFYSQNPNNPEVPIASGLVSTRVNPNI
jgi:M6 family metalloprotease-like protein